MPIITLHANRCRVYGVSRNKGGGVIIGGNDVMGGSDHAIPPPPLSDGNIAQCAGRSALDVDAVIIVIGS